MTVVNWSFNTTLRRWLSTTGGFLPIHRSMNGPVQLVTPDRLQIRDGGGCMSVFGLPFLAAGIFLFLTIVGVVPMGNADEMPAWAWPFLSLMAVAFTAVGGGLAFGRSWTTIDRAQRQVIRQLGLLIPMRERIMSLDGYTAVRLGVEQGDSDTVDKFPVALTGPAGSTLPLHSFTDYTTARQCAKAVAAHLQLEIEDASTDHPVRLTPSHVDTPLRQRVRLRGPLQADAARPLDARSEVTRELGVVTIVIPARRMHVLTMAMTLVPIAIVLAIGPPLSTFFAQSNTPDPVEWVFIGFLGLFFGVLPVTMIVGGFVRSRRGATILEASTEGLRIFARGILSTRLIAAFDADDILDVDFSSRDSRAASARRAAEDVAFNAYPAASRRLSPRMERVLATLARSARGTGVSIKTVRGITAIGQELDDDEIRYLSSVIRRALTG